jgi:hypothetical protein
MTDTGAVLGAGPAQAVSPRGRFFAHRDLRPHRERGVDLGHHNDITWPLGGVRPYRPYILGARRGVGRPAERAFRLTHVGHLPSLRTAAA